MEIPNIKSINNSILAEKVFKMRYPEFYKFIIDNYKGCKTLSEKLHLYYNNLTERPKCIICGNEVGFEGLMKGFRKYCSRKCSNNSQITKIKTVETNLKRYGVDNPSQNKTIKEKVKQTNLKRYGFEHATQNKTIKEKVKQTNLKRYGTEYASQNKYIKEKTKQTNLERYGVGCSLLNNLVREKKNKTNIERYGTINISQSDIVRERVKQTIINIHPDLLRYDENDNWICKCPHAKCVKCLEKEYITTSKIYYDRKHIGSELCTKLLPIQSLSSTPELQIRNFLDSLNIEYKTNDRSIIAPKELDIYIPSRNIAVEFNGSYWHSNKDKYYHQNKTKACYSKGILLIHIYEHEWNANKESILSKLKDILEGKEVDGIVSVKDYDKYILSEPVLIDCGPYKIWNEGEWQLKHKFIRK